ncbi:hypothetical protein GQ53DRAFT_406221 [Thozetella sp. PMI_491]|nr:hypothetical protein GQ53DRAFT_406221 [Thozetella sp. PMI_491]
MIQLGRPCDGAKVQSKIVRARACRCQITEALVPLCRSRALIGSRTFLDKKVGSLSKRREERWVCRRYTSACLCTSAWEKHSRRGVESEGSQGEDRTAQSPRCDGKGESGEGAGACGVWASVAEARLVQLSAASVAHSAVRKSVAGLQGTLTPRSATRGSPPQMPPRARLTRRKQGLLPPPTSASIGSQSVLAGTPSRHPARTPRARPSTSCRCLAWSFGGRVAAERLRGREAGEHVSWKCRLRSPCGKAAACSCELRPPDVFGPVGTCSTGRNIMDPCCSLAPWPVPLYPL